MVEKEFLENKLSKLVEGAGVVKSVYGGFSIQVTKERAFNYAAVFRALLEAGQLISIEKQDETLVINAK